MIDETQPKEAEGLAGKELPLSHLPSAARAAVVADGQRMKRHLHVMLRSRTNRKVKAQNHTHNLARHNLRGHP